MITSKLTSKGQTTIPQPGRAALHVNAGDEVAYTIEKDRVILTKASTALVDDPFATFDEWASKTIARPMPSFEPWDVIRVPFSYADRSVRQRRPALVIAAGGIKTAPNLLWISMITSDENRSWPEDVLVADLTSAGLPAPSVVRCAKVRRSTLSDAERIGTQMRTKRRKVAQNVNAALARLKA